MEQCKLKEEELSIPEYPKYYCEISYWQICIYCDLSTNILANILTLCFTILKYYVTCHINAI